MLERARVDWAGWVERWDRQQGNYLPDRDAALGMVLDVVQGVVGEPGRLVDLASGPGSIAVRAVRRFGGTRALAVDADPFLLALGREAAGSDRIGFRRANLLEVGWDDVLGDEPVDAVCSATSLHYFSAGEFAELARVLARRIRPDGVFVNLDTLRLGAEAPRLSALAANIRDHSWDGSPATRDEAADNDVAGDEAAGDEAADGGGAGDGVGREDWERWWADARAEPAFAELFAERDRLAAAPTESAPVTLPEMTEALRSAGFAEVGVLDQTADKHLIVAIR